MGWLWWPSWTGWFSWVSGKRPGFLNQYRPHVSTEDRAYRQWTSAGCVFLWIIITAWICMDTRIHLGKQIVKYITLCQMILLHIWCVTVWTVKLPLSHILWTTSPVGASCTDCCCDAREATPSTSTGPTTEGKTGATERHRRLGEIWKWWWKTW